MKGQNSKNYYSVTNYSIFPCYKYAILNNSVTHSAGRCKQLKDERHFLNKKPSYDRLTSVIRILIAKIIA